MKTIGIVMAMQKEYNLLVNALQGITAIREKGFHAVEGSLGRHRVILALSGIGKVCAAVCTSELIRRYRPDFLLNAGVSGGLSHNLRVGDVVVGTEVCYHDVSCGTDLPWGQVQGFPLFYPASVELLQVFDRIPHPVHRGQVCCGDCFLSQPETFGRLRAHFPDALAVDMESGAIAQTAYIYDVPFAVIRIISDIAGTDDNYDQYNDFWKHAPAEIFGLVKSFLETIE